MIKAGDKVPSVTIKTEDGKDVDVAQLFAGKKVVMFSLPGAFTPTCSQKHLPGYVEKLPELKAQGVDLVACLSVNDFFVMKAWAESQGALGKITMLSDGDGKLSKALGIDTEIPALGLRARRGLFTFEDGVTKSAEVEEAGKFDVSSAESCLVTLGK